MLSFLHALLKMNGLVLALCRWRSGASCVLFVLLPTGQAHQVLVLGVLSVNVSHLTNLCTVLPAESVNFVTLLCISCVPL
jgi:hypothetical protein